MSILLYVTVPNKETFDAYHWNAWGDPIEYCKMPDGSYRFIIDYGNDRARAEEQLARFQSGLHWGTITEEVIR